jgi:hypothetical protein
MPLLEDILAESSQSEGNTIKKQKFPEGFVQFALCSGLLLMFLASCEECTPLGAQYQYYVGKCLWGP